MKALNGEEWDTVVPVRDLGSEMREYLSVSGLLERGMCMRDLLSIVVVVDDAVEERMRHYGYKSVKRALRILFEGS